MLYMWNFELLAFVCKLLGAYSVEILISAAHDQNFLKSLRISIYIVLKALYGRCLIVSGVFRGVFPKYL